MSGITLEEKDVATPAPEINIRAALVQAWGEFPVAIKDRTNQGAGGNRYATLDSVIETIKPVLAKHGLMPRQDITTSLDSKSLSDKPWVSVKTRVYHSSGEMVEFDALTLPVVQRAGSRTDMGPQDFGSAVTYARRYSLLAALGISTGDDDDAQRAQPRHQSAHQQQGSPKKGSTLKDDLNKSKTFGKAAAKKLEEYAASHNVSVDEIREHLSSLGSNHAQECTKPIDKWPAEWRSKVNEFILSRHEKEGAAS